MVELRSFELDGIRFVQDTRVGKDRGRSERDAFVLVKTKAHLEFYRGLARRNPKHILEVGMFEGGSLVYFDKLYKPDKLVGVDLRQPIPALEEYRAERPHIVPLYETAQDADHLPVVLREHFPDGIDLIVDDASHLYNLTRKTFHLTFPLLKPGGLYVIEDWDWSHGPAAQRPDHPRAQKDALTSLIFELLINVPLGKIARLEVRKGLAAIWKAKGAADAIDLSDARERLRGRPVPRV